MKKNKLIIIVSILLVQALSVPALAAEPLILDDNLKRKNIGLNIEYCADNEKSFTFEQISSTTAENTNNWIQSQSAKLSFGFTKTVYWLRFTVRNSSDKRIEWYLHQEYPLIDYINLYIPDKNNTYKIIETGDQFVFSKRPVRYRSFVFPLSLEAQASKTFYMRYESSSSMNIHLTAWLSADFQQFRQTETIVLWIFITIMATMFLYSLFIYTSVREIEYFYYVTYILTFTLFMMSLNRMAFQHLWPQSVSWSNLSVPFFMGLINFSIIQFFRYFAETWKVIKKWEDMVLRILMITALCLSVLTLITGDYRISIIATTALTGMSTSAGSIFFFKYCLFLPEELKIKQARFLLIAFSFFLIGVLLYVLKTFAMLPSNIITENSILIGAALEVILISFGLADKINTMKNELSDFNQNLELKVERRTDELNAAMEEMEAMNEHLVETVGELANTQYIAMMDMKMAVAVQEALLPKEPPRAPGWDIAYIFKPMSGVSGDLFDFYQENGNLQGLSLMDVSGHGIASGLITMIARSVISRNFLNKSELKLREILEKINSDLISEMGDAENYLTGIILRFSGNKVEYVNAAHPGLLYKRAGSKKITEVDKKDHDFRGMFLGMEIISLPFEEISFDISDNDTLLLYCDCLQESTNPEGEPYSTRRIIESFQNAPDGTARQMLDYIMNDFSSFVQGKDLTDDLTVIIARKTG